MEVRFGFAVTVGAGASDLRDARQQSRKACVLKMKVSEQCHFTGMAVVIVECSDGDVVVVDRDIASRWSAAIRTKLGTGSRSSLLPAFFCLVCCKHIVSPLRRYLSCILPDAFALLLSHPGQQRDLPMAPPLCSIISLGALFIR